MYAPPSRPNVPINYSSGEMAGVLCSIVDSVDVVDYKNQKEYPQCVKATGTRICRTLSNLHCEQHKTDISRKGEHSCDPYILRGFIRLVSTNPLLYMVHLSAVRQNSYLAPIVWVFLYHLLLGCCPPSRPLVVAPPDPDVLASAGLAVPAIHPAKSNPAPGRAGAPPAWGTAPWVFRRSYSSRISGSTVELR